MKDRYNVLVAGGGNAGISVAAQLKRKQKHLSVGIIEPSAVHYYQPAWTMVGAGIFDNQKTIRQESTVIPKDVDWIQDKVEGFHPHANKVETENSGQISYDYLIVALGIQLNWDHVQGLRESLGQNGVCSNYGPDNAVYTWQAVQEFKGGTAIFTSPPTAVKCGGAPQKAMYLSCDHWRKKGILSDSKVDFRSGGTILFGIDKYRPTLEHVVKRYGIHVHLFNELVAVDGASKKAMFKNRNEADPKPFEVDFDLIHTVPPQGPPDVVSRSEISDTKGWVAADKYTLQHPTFPNIFSLGDVSGIPCSKTGAAIRKQAPVVVENLVNCMHDAEPSAKYDGYSSCPIITGYGKVMLCEFDYDNRPKETFPFDQSKERWSMYVMKKDLLPRLYWSRILKGKM